MSPGGLRQSTLPLGHGGPLKFCVREEETFVSLKPECMSGGRTCDLRFSNQAALPMCTRLVYSTPIAETIHISK